MSIYKMCEETIHIIQKKKRKKKPKQKRKRRNKVIFISFDLYTCSAIWDAGATFSSSILLPLLVLSSFLKKKHTTFRINVYAMQQILSIYMHMHAHNSTHTHRMHTKHRTYKFKLVRLFFGCCFIFFYCVGATIIMAI